MDEQIVTDTSGFTQEGQGTIMLRAKSQTYFIGPSGIGVQRGETLRRLSWHEIAVLRRIIGRKVGSAKLEFVARQTPPGWLPMFALEHIPLHWLTTVIHLDPRRCGTSEAAVIEIVRRFAPSIRVYDSYRRRIITGDLDGPEIKADVTTHGSGDGIGSDGD